MHSLWRVPRASWPSKVGVESGAMMPNGFLPNTDSALKAWAQKFSVGIAEMPEHYGITPQQSADFAALTETFEADLLASQPPKRSMSTTLQKNQSRGALKAEARRLVNLINGQKDVSMVERKALGLTIRSRPARAAVPDEPPALSIISAAGQRVSIQLRSRFGERVKPPNVIGATLFCCVSAEAPTDESQWRFVANTGRASIVHVFKTPLPPGTSVWYSAQWLNTRLQGGPMSAPRMTYVQGGMIEFDHALAA